MTRKTFKDQDDKKGVIGDVVSEKMYGEVSDKKLTVSKIISLGRGGTRIYFKEGGFGNPKYYILIK